MAKKRGTGKEKSESQSTDKKEEVAKVPLHVLDGHTKAVTVLAFAPDGRTLASGSKDTQVRFWATTTGEECNARVMGAASWGITEVVFSPNGRAVVAVSQGVNRPIAGETRAFLGDLAMHER